MEYGRLSAGGWRVRGGMAHGSNRICPVTAAFHLSTRTGFF